jgi:hypothetical protein
VIREQHLSPGNSSLRLAAKVKHDLEQLARIGAFVQRLSEVGRECAGEQLDLLIPLRVLRSRGDLASDASL